MPRKSLMTLLALLAAAASLSAATARYSLDGEWTLKYFPQPEPALTTPDEVSVKDAPSVNAKVPGNVELDLMASGLVPDPSVGRNIYLLRQFEGYQWCYSREFPAPSLEEGQRAVLSFGGIDTFADIWLNGKKAGSADNMLISHDFDVTSILCQGTNRLEVIIRSSVLEAQKHFLGAISIGNFSSEESVYSRRAPSTYGWDIMPRLVSAGLWRSVCLKVEGPVSIVDAHWITRTTDKEKREVSAYLYLQARLHFDAFDKLDAVIDIRRNDKTVMHSVHQVRKAAFYVPFRIEDADLWWPRGYGEPALYEASVSLKDRATGEVYDTDTRRIGFRTVALDLNDVNLPGAPGEFRILVNGVPVFAKGTNWVPLDAFHSRDKEHYDEAVGLMTEMNCNIVRCWGGNVYEDTRFFDLCDENGIMVWQDFAMGCGNYPQGDEFAAMIEKEAVSVVRKFRNHASLVLWSGNNENDQSMIFGRMRDMHLDPNRDRTSRNTLARVVYEFDPSRPYLPSSPYYSPAVFESGSGDELLPENHLWGPRGYYKAEYYSKNPSQFVSEIGYHGCPGLESLKKMFTPSCVYPWTDFHTLSWNDEWQTKANRVYDGEVLGRNDLMTNQVLVLFGEVPSDLEDFIYASQCVQAEAMKYFVERWRGGRPYRTGIIWWNIRDGWPLLSDAVSDYYGSKKRAFYYLKNVHGDVCCMINDDSKGQRLMVDNCTLADASGEVEVSDVESGRVLYKGKFKAEANTAVQIARIPARKGQGMLLIRYKVDGKEYANHYLYGEPPFKLDEYRTLIDKTGIYEN